MLRRSPMTGTSSMASSAGASGGLLGATSAGSVCERAVEVGVHDSSVGSRSRDLGQVDAQGRRSLTYGRRGRRRDPDRRRAAAAGTMRPSSAVDGVAGAGRSPLARRAGAALQARCGRRRLCRGGGVGASWLGAVPAGLDSDQR